MLWLPVVAGLGLKQPTLGLPFDKLTRLVGGSGRAKSVWDAVRAGYEPLSREAQLTRHTRTALQQHCSRFVPAWLDEAHTARDGTTKLLIRLADGLAVEAVVIPHLSLPRTTLCVSTQVGCDRGCSFCATGQMGLVRDLTADEIAAQYFIGSRFATISNVVFMGMGDAGCNARNSAEAAAILTDDSRFKLAKSKVTVSTVGPSPQCFKLLARAPCMLAWSLHSADDELRRQLVPTHTRFTVEELRQGLMDALQQREGVRTRTLMVAATLIDGVNDSVEDATSLATFVKPLVDVAVKVNIDLIPVNPVPHAPHFKPPTDENLNAFCATLRSVEPRAHVAVRVQRGDDKAAACGQLATTVAARRRRAR